MKSAYYLIRFISSSSILKAGLPLFFISCLMTLSGCAGKSTEETIQEDTTTIDSIPAAVVDSIAESEAKTAEAPAIPLITDPHIVVDKPNLEIRLIKGGEVIFRAPITCGRMKGQKKMEKDRRTPEGNFRIVSIEDATHKLYRTDDGRLVPHVYGPWFLRLDADGWGGIGIHGTNAPGQISQRRSKGCIRMLNKDITKLHEYARVGMQVIVLPDNDSDPDVYYYPSSPAKSKSQEVVEKEEVMVETPENVSSPSPENVSGSPESETPAPSNTAPAEPAPAANPAPAPSQPAVPAEPAPAV